MNNLFADNRCKILITHLVLTFAEMRTNIVNIIEKLSGSGRDDNGILIPGVTVERHKMETK